MPSAPKVAVVAGEFAFAKTTVPPAESSRPLILLHVVVIALGGLGSPSSRALPASVAEVGKEIVWSGPAFTAGGWFTGSAGYSTHCGTICVVCPEYAHWSLAVATVAWS